MPIHDRIQHAYVILWLRHVVLETAALMVATDIEVGEVRIIGVWDCGDVCGHVLILSR